MPNKQIVVLANSVRRGQSCIAGRELLFKEGRTEFGSWIRPISQQGEGEISSDESRLSDRTQPQVLDIVEIPLLRKVVDVCQPENWLIERGPWQKISSMEKENIFVLEEEPAHLWVERGGGRSDRVSSFALQNMSGVQSLYLIKPERFHMEIYREWNEYEDYYQNKRRAFFRYKTVDYKLPITDPVINDKYFTSFPDPGDGKKKIELQGGDNCLICISLTPKFRNDYHYKIIATVIEL